MTKPWKWMSTVVPHKFLLQLLLLHLTYQPGHESIITCLYCSFSDSNLCIVNCYTLHIDFCICVLNINFPICTCTVGVASTSKRKGEMEFLDSISLLHWELPNGE